MEYLQDEPSHNCDGLGAGAHVRARPREAIRGRWTGHQIPLDPISCFSMQPLAKFKFLEKYAVARVDGL